MNYALAKQLKDAGFPQEDRHFYFSDHTLPVTRWDVNALDKLDEEISAAYLFADPTLEELIEACGTVGFSLSEEGKDKWRANTAPLIERFYGSTPAEAVAHLWLALNKK